MVVQLSTCVCVLRNVQYPPVFWQWKITLNQGRRFSKTLPASRVWWHRRVLTNIPFKDHNLLYSNLPEKKRYWEFVPIFHQYPNVVIKSQFVPIPAFMFSWKPRFLVWMTMSTKGFGSKSYLGTLAGVAGYIWIQKCPESYGRKIRLPVLPLFWWLSVWGEDKTTGNSPPSMKWSTLEQIQSKSL